MNLLSASAKFEINDRSVIHNAVGSLKTRHGDDGRCAASVAACVHGGGTGATTKGSNQFHALDRYNLL